MSEKPHMGKIVDWYERPCGEEHGLGYMIVGRSVDHPRFAGEMFHTSFVVERVGNEIETNNSRYTLVTEENDRENS